MFHKSCYWLFNDALNAVFLRQRRRFVDRRKMDKGYGSIRFSGHRMEKQVAAPRAADQAKEQQQGFLLFD